MSIIAEIAAEAATSDTGPGDFGKIIAMISVMVVTLFIIRVLFNTRRKP